MDPATLLRHRVEGAGLGPVTAVTPVAEGFAAESGFVDLADGRRVFAKAFTDAGTARGAFTAEAEGLSALRDLGGLRTPEVLTATDDVLALEALAPRPDSADFWQALAHAVAALHLRTRHDRFGWHRDNWLGRERQDNTWDDDGFAFFARSRVLRWLPEPRVRAKLSVAERRGLERLCARLPELLPVMPACLTHGDLWSQNVVADAAGAPAVIDPAVSYTWAEVDVAMMWFSPRPATAEVFFDVYAELTGLVPGWRDRARYVQLRQHLTLMAQYDHDWGATDTVRDLVAPFV